MVAVAFSKDDGCCKTVYPNPELLLQGQATFWQKFGLIKVSRKKTVMATRQKKLGGEEQLQPNECAPIVSIFTFASCAPVRPFFWDHYITRDTEQAK